MMTKLLIGLLGAGVIATGGYAAATGLEADPARTVSLPAATSTEDTTTTPRPWRQPRPPISTTSPARATRRSTVTIRAAPARARRRRHPRRL